ncbi:MAG TPA: NAD-dependent succinate-semialdehyde dehydrogenase [Steroidobacteraceae bacterium]|jgi:succinate-semialdehyde dehydrogenase/glutarate-semialdehyde dehydrogenase|nr:NAD-dependent succinate-semialdehyde dehydrogenase [Steroidobacteraceae bacterium]
MQLKDPSLLKNRSFINGQWVGADGGAVRQVRNPANGEIVSTVPDGGTAEARRAIEAARDAFPAWRARTAEERARILRRWFDLMIEHQDDLARIMTSEQGKPLSEAKGEITYAASFIEWFSEETRRIYGDVVPSPWGDKRIIVVREPVGVCVAITPWNFPAAMITRKAAPALAAGCTMVLKPAMQTPLSALAMAELAARAGVPAGVFSVVTGNSKQIGAEFTSNPIVRKLTFTGSTEIGRQLAAQCAPTLKHLSLELGGNAPFIVFDDADLDLAVQGAIASKYRNSGQTCVCANRLFVQDGIYDAFSKKLAAAVMKLKVGDGFESGIEQGPLIDETALAKVEELIDDAVTHGAKALVGGRRHALGRTFYEPTVLTDVSASMKIAQEEIFGPVAPLFRFKTEADAIRMANDTEFGLAAYFFAKDVSRVWRVAGALECGIIGINTGVISTAVAPFGGMKQSGVGREGSRHGMDEYLEMKYLCMGVAP